MSSIGKQIFDAADAADAKRDAQVVMPPAPPHARLNAVMEDAMTKRDFDTFDLLRLMQGEVIKELLDRLRSGTATHQELAIMVRMLKDNGITLMPPTGAVEPADGPSEIEGEPLGFVVSSAPLPQFAHETEDADFEMDPNIELTPGTAPEIE